MLWLVLVAVMIAVPVAVGINLWFEVRREQRAERDVAVSDVNVKVNA